MRSATSIALLLVLLVAPAAAHAAAVDSADDICAADTDPCQIQSPIEVAAGSVLDFGSRTVRVTQEGRLNFASGAGPSATRIRCGRLVADVEGSAVVLADAGSPDAYHKIEVRAEKRCDARDRACLEDGDCQLGACGVRRCTMQPQRVCTIDAACQLGTCVPSGFGSGRCSGDRSVACLSNFDCDLGSCGAQITCEGSAAEPVSCGSDADCAFGACSAGDGRIRLAGEVETAGSFYGSVSLLAAGDVTVEDPVDLTSEIPGEDTILTVRSGQADVRLQAPVTTDAGTVRVTADDDVHVLGSILADGPEGGSIKITAGRDVITSAGMSVRSTNGDGGFIDLTAGRDVLLEGGSAAAPVLFDLDGTALNEFGEGWAGWLEVHAARDAVVSEHVRIQASSPDGAGGYIDVIAEGTVTMAGDIEATGSGSDGYGGEAWFEGYSVEVPASAEVDVSGTDAAEAGWISLLATTLRVGGSLQNGGRSAEPVNDLWACTIVIDPEARIRHSGPKGENILTARNSVTVASGAEIVSDHSVNRLRLHPAASDPVVEGLVDPAFTVEITDDVPTCGCQNDGDCDDGVACTEDECVGGECIASLRHESCDDGVYCNGVEQCWEIAGCLPGLPVSCGANDDTCSEQTCDEDADACVTVPRNEGLACDDDQPCTEQDVCSSGTCTGVLDPLCTYCGDGIVEDDEECDDGNDSRRFMEVCGVGCVAIPCGFVVTSGSAPTASDALAVLKGAVGIYSSCPLQLCDVTGNGNVTAADALHLLAHVIGRPIDLYCPD